jgi:hypothetical protein
MLAMALRRGLFTSRPYAMRFDVGDDDAWVVARRFLCRSHKYTNLLKIRYNATLKRAA